MLISLQGSDMIGGGTFSKENGGMIKSFGNIMVGQSAYVTYDQNNVEFDAYEAKSRDERVPLSVKSKEGRTTYSNFDTDPDIMYKYTPDDAKNVPDIVKSKAGRIFGGDFTFEFSSSDDENYDTNSILMNKLKGYRTGVINIGSGNYKVEGNGGNDKDDDKDDDDKKEITPITGNLLQVQG